MSQGYKGAWEIFFVGECIVKAGNWSEAFFDALRKGKELAYWRGIADYRESE